MKHTIPETLTDIQRAARFYYLQKVALVGSSKGRLSDRRRWLRRD
ncbi:putative dNA adenine methylase [Burkholderia cepacia]|nr:putative dNA adenine methylase [Burkholderia cepacia]